ncbi:MOSC domain-containing protein [Cellulomonas sp. S1-8]|uniref:MOSC domain-containing protein n=1 Tax=Cellulomonas sp. S1-8 TaxID=2904790 RepID=UPI002243DA9B|nr:MOSC N-terminal beta barrel domain-containing protein [Cellulomonas sp. S1-8]UZN03801.1 MOSC domain-containing protein [Cellulomonas sp. S1-8]
MVVTSLRRYPVKSMGGEALTSAELDHRGIRGDRWYAVVDGDGRFASVKDSRRFRRRDAVVNYTASTTADGEVEVRSGDASWLVGDPLLDGHLTSAMGSAQRLLPEAAVPHQDAGAVSLVGTATIAWCAARWGGSDDPRRLRVNVVVETQTPFVEETWVGRRLALGSAVLTVVERIPRCRMIDVEQDGTSPGAPWLRPLGAERDLCLAVYADVVRPGVVAVGDEVSVV